MYTNKHFPRDIEKGNNKIITYEHISDIYSEEQMKQHSY